MPRFVILRHTLPSHAARGSHFDLMLEDEGQLLTWAIAELPNPEPQTAEQLPPHRLDYLTYEGPVSNDRGEVRREIAGTFTWWRCEANELHVHLQSTQLSGELCLVPTEDTHWKVRFQPATT